MHLAVPPNEHASKGFALGPIVRVLEDDGTIDPSSDPKIDVERIVHAYRTMARVRMIDMRLIALQEEGRVGFHIGPFGEEAAIIGAAASMRDQDWIFPGHREFGAALHRGMPISHYAHHMFGDAFDPTKGRQTPDHYTARSVRFGSVGGPAGAQITQGVGLAWAAKTKKDDVLSLIYFNDAQTSAGEFHNGMNFAGVFKAPAILFCRNNAWADGNDEVFADKAIAYGLHSVRCDGDDLFAVMKVVRDAIERASHGDGPTMIEALTSRILANGKDRTVGRDPIERVRQYLQAKGVWDSADQKDLEAETNAELDEAIANAESAPAPPLESMFTDVYEGMPPHLRAQFEASRANKKSK